MNNIYKITVKNEKGAMYLMYKKGEVREVLFDFDPPLGPYRAQLIAKFFPFQEVNIKPLAKGAEVEAVLLQPRTVNDKAAAFCMMFRAHRNTAYTPKKNERANLAQVTMSDKLLEVYFTNDTFPLSYAKSMNDYIRHYNYIRDLATNGKPTKTGFPDVYDHEYERGLDGEKLSAYRVHLVKLGWRKASDIGWIKLEQNQ